MPRPPTADDASHVVKPDDVILCVPLARSPMPIIKANFFPFSRKIFLRLFSFLPPSRTPERQAFYGGPSSGSSACCAGGELLLLERSRMSNTRSGWARHGRGRRKRRHRGGRTGGEGG